jgi:hypothetical protein
VVARVERIAVPHAEVRVLADFERSDAVLDAEEARVVDRERAEADLMRQLVAAMKPLVVFENGVAASGEAVRMFSCCRANCSTRKGVAWARRSTSMRSWSTAMRLASLRADSRSMNMRRDS